ncbi:MAG: hypothetical protein JWO49_2249 [Arthrobacter sp.]|nr:hypothetical protein [Arthrobacter sp.]MCU1548111.1 hypothetical protein [Arthrobacter sp.]
MTGNQDLDGLLRSLDAADHRRPADTRRARADLQRIRSTDPAPARQHPTTSTIPGRRRPPGSTARAARRAAVAAGMVAAATAGLIILPPLSGGDPAFASWTAAPAGLTGQERTSAAAECRASQQDTGGGMYAGDVDTAELAIAERRGAWTTVVLTGTDGFSAMCITDDSASLFNKGMIGSVGKPAGYAAPGPRELTATDLGTGTMSAGNISLAAGSAGSEVVGVIYRSRAREKVTATVSQGRFALWLPGNELQNAATNGIEVEVTYRDGTTGTNRLTL